MHARFSCICLQHRQYTTYVRRDHSGYLSLPLSFRSGFAVYCFMHVLLYLCTYTGQLLLVFSVLLTLFIIAPYLCISITCACQHIVLSHIVSYYLEWWPTSVAGSSQEGIQLGCPSCVSVDSSWRQVRSMVNKKSPAAQGKGERGSTWQHTFHTLVHITFSR